MKKLLALAASLTLCAAMLCLPAAAEDAAAPDSAERPSTMEVYGTIADYQDGTFTLESSDPNQMEMVIHLPDGTPIVDAASGLPLSQTDLRNGDTVYTWVGPAMTMSLPPQTSASVVVANVPADAAAPQYYEIAASSGITGTAPNRSVTLTAAGGKTFTVTDSATIVPFETKNRVMLDDLIPGTNVLVWSDNNAVSKVVVFPYAYRGYLRMTADGLTLNGEALAKSWRMVSDEIPYLPLRAVAEAAGYTVVWDANLGAVVSDQDTVLFSVHPDSRVLRTADDAESELNAPCLIADGTTYLLATELADLLHLYLAS